MAQSVSNVLSPTAAVIEMPLTVFSECQVKVAGLPMSKCSKI